MDTVLIHELTLEERAKIREGEKFRLPLERGSFSIVPLRADLNALTSQQLKRIQSLFARTHLSIYDRNEKHVAHAEFRAIDYRPRAAKPLHAVYEIKTVYT